MRAIMGVLIAAMVGVAAAPVFVLRDLNSGGTGWGLCEGGVRGCSNSYFAGFELIAAVLLVLLVLVGLYRVALKALRWTEHYYDRRRAESTWLGPEAVPSAGRGEFDGPTFERRNGHQR